ncbi:MAG TPA: ABC transporter permease [Conexibacter sp.]|nr:ABC transporter permease [Conexibacter sp.]
MSARAGRLGLEVGVTALIFAAIWLFTTSSDSYLVVALPDMLSRFREVWLFDRVGSDLVPSLVRMTYGYVTAVVVGVVVGVAIGLMPLLRALTHPLISFMRAVPPIALLPPAIIVLGLGNSMRVFIIAFVCVWPVLLNAADGTAELNKTLTDTARVYGLSIGQRLRFVILPAASPRIFAGMRTSLSFAVLLLVTSEWIASTNGVGSFLIQAQQTFRITDMWAAIILLGLLGYSLNQVFSLVERRVLRWHLRSTATSA